MMTSQTLLTFKSKLKTSVFFCDCTVYRPILSHRMLLRATYYLSGFDAFVVRNKKCHKKQVAICRLYIAFRSN